MVSVLSGRFLKYVTPSPDQNYEVLAHASFFLSTSRQRRSTQSFFNSLLLHQYQLRELFRYCQKAVQGQLRIISELVENVPATIFHGFPEIPVEIRNMIWTYTANLLRDVDDWRSRIGTSERTLLWVKVAELRVSPAGFYYPMSFWHINCKQGR